MCIRDRGEDGTHHQTKYLREEDYLPIGSIIRLDDRNFRVAVSYTHLDVYKRQDCKSAKGKTYNATVLLGTEADGRSKFSLEFEGGC